MSTYFLLILSVTYTIHGGEGEVVGVKHTEEIKDKIDDVDILRDIEEEIDKLTSSTQENKRKENVERYEKIFLRLGATGAQALGRNMLYASTQTVFQGDDDEENQEDQKRRSKDDTVNIIEDWLDDSELEATGRSQFVPQILGEPLFYVPSSYWLQVVGRSLTSAGFLGGTVVGLRKLELRCTVNDWTRILGDYNSNYYPSSDTTISYSELRFRLAQFQRRARSGLRCLQGTGYLHNLLDQLNIVLEDKIEEIVSDERVISDDVLKDSILSIYDSTERVTSLLSSDWRTSSSVTTTLLISKILGFGLITWGRNIGDWPDDVPLSDVSTGYRVGIIGRSLLYVLFVIDDFRKLEGYTTPTCSSDDVFQVLSKYSSLLYEDQRPSSSVQRRLEIQKFSHDLQTSLSCLTSTPAQFLDIEALEAEEESEKLKDNLRDLINIVELRGNNVP